MDTTKTNCQNGTNDLKLDKSMFGKKVSSTYFGEKVLMTVK